MSTNNRVCPNCGGRWIRNFVFDHDRRSPACEIGTAEDMVQYQDFRMLETWPYTYTRPCSLAERLLVRVFVPDPGDDSAAETVVSLFAPGIHHRVVYVDGWDQRRPDQHGIDPDEIVGQQS